MSSIKHVLINTTEASPYHDLSNLNLPVEYLTLLTLPPVQKHTAKFIHIPQLLEYIFTSTASHSGLIVPAPIKENSNQTLSSSLHSDSDRPYQHSTEFHRISTNVGRYHSIEDMKYCCGAPSSRPQYSLQGFPFPSSLSTLPSFSSSSNNDSSDCRPLINHQEDIAVLSYCNLDTTILQHVMVRVGWLDQVLHLRSEMVESDYPPLDLEGTQTRDEIYHFMKRWNHGDGTNTVVW